MRSHGRSVPSFGSLAASFTFASIAIGISFGIAGGSAGLRPHEVLLLSLLVFGGGAQFGALGVILAGGTPAAAVTVGLMLNARFLLMGVSAGMHVRAPLLRRLGMAFLSIDASLLVATLQDDPVRAERDFWRMGTLIYIAWQIGTVAGLAAGTVFVDIDRFGLDALIMVTFIGLLVPLVNDRRTFLAMIAGGTTAVLLLRGLPPGVPVLLAGLAGAVVGSVVGDGPVPRMLPRALLRSRGGAARAEGT